MSHVLCCCCCCCFIFAAALSHLSKQKYVYGHNATSLLRSYCSCVCYCCCLAQLSSVACRLSTFGYFVVFAFPLFCILLIVHCFWLLCFIVVAVVVVILIQFVLVVVVVIQFVVAVCFCWQPFFELFIFICVLTILLQLNLRHSLPTCLFLHLLVCICLCVFVRFIVNFTFAQFAFNSVVHNMYLMYICKSVACCTFECMIVRDFYSQLFTLQSSLP